MSPFVTTEGYTAKIQTLGYEVHVFTPYHIRLDKRLDIFLSDRRSYWKWRDIASGQVGTFFRDDVKKFIGEWFAKHPAPPKPTQVNPFAPVPLPTDFKGKLKELYCNDRPWDEIWALVEAEINSKEKPNGLQRESEHHEHLQRCSS